VTRWNDLAECVLGEEPASADDARAVLAAVRRSVEETGADEPR
jgi:hypothetical protein